jgi:hypothetical protein
MSITLYRNSSPRNKINKTLTAVATLNGTLRDSCDVMSPSVQVEYSRTDFNYVKISEFNDRYYFVDSIEVIRNNVIRINCRVDVLESFKNDILSCDCIVAKNANRFNLYINDNTLRAYQNPYYQYAVYPNSFGVDFENVLLIAGG